MREQVGPNVISEVLFCCRMAEGLPKRLAVKQEMEKMDRKEYDAIRTRALELYDRAQIILTPKERENLEVADMGLGQIERIGLEAVTYINTERVCGKELALLPGQTCPEHVHPPLGGGNIGKEETFRCRYGEVYVYVPGNLTRNRKAVLPVGSEAYFTALHEIVLHPGDEYTLRPNTRHWFQAGPEGAIVSEFSTKSTDENDVWTDPRIKRIPVIK